MRSRTLPVLLLVAALSVGGGGAAHAAAKPFDLESARIPAACGHPAARLTGGVKHFGTRPDGTSRGQASLVSSVHSFTAPIRKPIHATQQTSSRFGAYEVAPILCDAGGVGHPETVVLYDRRGTILASTYLGSASRQEHASVTSVSLRGSHFRVHWDSYDGAGFHLHHDSATFTLLHGSLHRSNAHIVA